MMLNVWISICTITINSTKIDKYWHLKSSTFFLILIKNEHLLFILHEMANLLKINFFVHNTLIVKIWNMFITIGTISNL